MASSYTMSSHGGQPWRCHPSFQPFEVLAEEGAGAASAQPAPPQGRHRAEKSLEDNNMLPKAGSPTA